MYITHNDGVTKDYYYWKNMNAMNAMNAMNIMND